MVNVMFGWYHKVNSQTWNHFESMVWPDSVDETRRVQYLMVALLKRLDLAFQQFKQC